MGTFYTFLCWDSSLVFVTIQDLNKWTLLEHQRVSVSARFSNFSTRPSLWTIDVIFMFNFVRCTNLVGTYNYSSFGSVCVRSLTIHTKVGVNQTRGRVDCRRPDYKPTSFSRTKTRSFVVTSSVQTGVTGSNLCFLFALFLLGSFQTSCYCRA